MKQEPFTFGIPLIARASSDNWALVEALVELTLASLRAQTDPDVRIVIAGHDCPAAARGDPRVTFLRADWPAAPVRADNLDSGRKKHLINSHVMERGGGLLMFVDADDWVDRTLVAAARAEIAPTQVGGVIRAGHAVDIQTLRAAPIPHRRIFDDDFHRLCGSSIVARLRPDEQDPVRRDPMTVMHEHYRWVEEAREHGAPIARLSVPGVYVINSSANHSETHGPFADWRRAFTEAVNREGRPVDEAFLRRFGIDASGLELPARLQQPEAEGAERDVDGEDEERPERHGRIGDAEEAVAKA